MTKPTFDTTNKKQIKWMTHYPYSAEVWAEQGFGKWHVLCLVGGKVLDTYELANEELATLVARGFVAQCQFDSTLDIFPKRDKDSGPVWMLPQG